MRGGPDPNSLNPPPKIEDLPEPSERLGLGCLGPVPEIWIDQVVPRDQCQADGGDGSERQPREQRENHHAPSERPDDTGEEVVLVVEIEGPRQPDDGELEQHQNEPAGDRGTG